MNENAIDSLQHGMEHFLSVDVTPRDLKATIIHVFHAIELFLKAALARVHPNLIYLNLDSGLIRDDAHTVGFEKLLWRLQNFGIVLSVDEVNHLKSLQKTRNAIEHHKVSGHRDQVENYISHAVAFLDSFLPRGLQLELNSVLSDEYPEIRSRVYSYEQRLSLAQARLERAHPAPDGGWGEDFITECDSCGQELFCVRDSAAAERDGLCYFCDAEFYVTECNRCYRPILGEEPWTEENEPGLCTGCYEDVMLRE